MSITISTVLAAAIAAIAAGLISLAGSYFPGFSGWFEKLEPNHKRGVMGLGIILSGALGFGLSCAGFLESLYPGLGIACDQQGALSLVAAILAALWTNQNVYALTPKEYHSVKA